MTCFTFAGCRTFTLGVFLTLGVFAATNVWAGKPKPVKPKPNKPRSSGQIQFTDETFQQANFKFEGTEEQVGRFVATGELDFVPGAKPGTLAGSGVVVLKAGGCDRLVGVVTAQFDTNTGDCSFQFSWRDSVTLRNGKTVANSGRFVKNRPSGLIVVTTTRPQTPIIIIIIIIIITRT